MPEHTTTPTASSPSHPVTVYSIDCDSYWTEKGTGFCEYFKVNGDEPDEFVVRSATDSTPLVSSEVYAEKTYHNYRRLAGTLIYWTEVDSNDFALRFEDEESRDNIWLHMCNKRVMHKEAPPLCYSSDDEFDEDFYFDGEFEDVASTIDYDSDDDDNDQFYDAATTIDPDTTAHDDDFDSDSALDDQFEVAATTVRPNPAIRDGDFDSDFDQNFESDYYSDDQFDDDAVPFTLPDTIIPRQVALPILPTPTTSNLEEIVWILENSPSHRKPHLANFIVENNYVRKLLPVFEDCERMGMKDWIHELFTIMKFFIFLCDTEVLEHITNDDNIDQVAGILEYDPATPRIREPHRRNLQIYNAIEPVVPFHDPATLLTIQRTYRLQYLMDVMMAPYIDYDLENRLKCMIQRTHLDTLTHMQRDTNFLENIFNIIKCRNSDQVKQTLAIQAVLQMCTIAKALESRFQVQLYRDLAQYGLLIPIEIAISSEDSSMRSAGAAALYTVALEDVSLVRSHILSQQQRDASATMNNTLDLLQCIINQFTSPTDPNFQFEDILKLTLALGEHPRIRAITKTKFQLRRTPQIDGILCVFYQKYASSLLEPLMIIETLPMAQDGSVAVLEHRSDQGNVYSRLLAVVSLAVQYHGDQSKDWVLSIDCLAKVTQLFRSRFDWVKIVAVRFFRVCVGMDDSYHQHLINNNIFEPTMRFLVETGGKGAGNSTCLELLAFIQHENPERLVGHLIERFGAELVAHVPACIRLQQRYDKNEERRRSLTSLALASSTKRKRGDDDEDDEDKARAAKRH